MLGCVAFERVDGDEGLLLIANRNEEAISYNLPQKWQNAYELLYEKNISDSVYIEPMSAVILQKDF